MTGYQVVVKELQHRDGTKDVVPVDVTDFNTKTEEASINQGLSENLQNYVAFILYKWIIIVCSWHGSL